MFAFFTPGPMEMCIIGLIAVLLFGSRLPSMAKSFGKSFTSFKQGLAEGKKELAEIEKETREATNDLKDSLKEEMI